MAMVQLSGNEVAEQINALAIPGILIDGNDERIVAIQDQIVRLAQADRLSASVLMAYVYQVTGRKDKAIAQLRGESDHHAMSNLLCVAGNVFDTQTAAIVFREIGHPLRARFSRCFSSAVATGQINLLAEYSRIARTMNMTNVDALPLDEIERAADILASFGTTDQQIGAVVDVAGGVLFEYGYTYSDEAQFACIQGGDGERLVRLQFRVAAPSSVVARLYLEFVDRLIDADMDMPAGFLISFIGAH